MIAYIQGKLLEIEDDDRVVVMAGGVGYEILLPPTVMQAVKTHSPGQSVSFYLYHHQTERQPKPVLIGFNRKTEKDFFRNFITVEDIGPLKAARALTLSVERIGEAIEKKDAAFLKSLKGVGARTADKIIAALHGKMGRFSFASDSKDEGCPETGHGRSSDLAAQVIAVLTGQLGYPPVEAKKMVGAAFRRNPKIDTPELLLDEVLKSSQRDAGPKS